LNPLRGPSAAPAARGEIVTDAPPGGDPLRAVNSRVVAAKMRRVVANEIDFSKVVPCERFVGDDAEDTELIAEMVKRARAYLGSFAWCRAIDECYIGDIAVGGVVAVTLFKIAPDRPGVDEWVWVIVGDLPPAYITTEEAPNAACALDGYIGAMQAWVEAVKTDRSVEDLIPVQTASGEASLDPTPEVVEMIEWRLSFLDREILSYHSEDLEATRET
jgi:hypothetical protein